MGGTTLSTGEVLFGLLLVGALIALSFTIGKRRGYRRGRIDGLEEADRQDRSGTPVPVGGSRDDTHRHLDN